MLNIYYNLFICSIIILSLCIYLIVLYRVSFKNHNTFLSRKFFILVVSLLVMIFINLICICNSDLKFFLVLFVFLSFYSMFLIYYGFGSGFKVKVVILFKIFSDLFILVVIGFIIIFSLNSDINFYDFLNLECFFWFRIFLVIIFLVYSLFGVFGLWLFWAMEASYFLSCYIHSCGFISLGLVFFYKLFFFNGDISDSFLFCINNFSIFSYCIFSLFFLLIKDIKKSFSYFSASSICFLFFIMINNPILGLIYFFNSSIIKVFLFEIMSRVRKFDYYFSFIFISLFILIFINFFLFFNHVKYESCCNLIDFILMFKFFTLFSFLIKIFLSNLFKFNIDPTPNVFLNNFFGLLPYSIICVVFYNESFLFNLMSKFLPYYNLNTESFIFIGFYFFIIIILKIFFFFVGYTDLIYVKKYIVIFFLRPGWWLSNLCINFTDTLLNEYVLSQLFVYYSFIIYFYYNYTSFINLDFFIYNTDVNFKPNFFFCVLFILMIVVLDIMYNN